MSALLVSKVLILDDKLDQIDTLKGFCENHNLVPLRVLKNRLMPVLRANIDLGAIFIAEDYVASGENYLQIAIRIHAIRPELPIILRRTTNSLVDETAGIPRNIFCATYSADDTSSLKQVIDEYIFSLYYPCELVRGISQITESVLGLQFKKQSLRWDTPHIVRDRVIFGEVFSLIPLESSWCRGYMMIQTEEQGILNMLDRQGEGNTEAGFRQVNSLLGETTNLIWGAFKNHYIGDSTAANLHVQVPLVVNHKHKYISFGTENPQLCFSYTVTDDETGQSVRFIQRFVFNLSWSPEDFSMINHDAEELLEAGELELF